MKIRKAVVPVAGYGTRFLPASKAIPKEMFPIVDKPIIQYVVEELIDAGIEQIIFVTSWHKTAIENHFDRHLELEHKLKEAGNKEEQIKKISWLSDAAEYVSIRQKELNGNGGAVLAAKNIVGPEPFICFFGDDLFSARPSRAKQLIAAFEEYNSPIIGGLETKYENDVNKYGFCRGSEIKDGIIDVDQIIEKPGTLEGVVNLAVSGFVSTPDLFEALESLESNNGKELVYVDGLNLMLKDKKKVYLIRLNEAVFHDCGNVLNYLETNVEFALKDNEIGDDFKKFIKKKARDLSR